MRVRGLYVGVVTLALAGGLLALSGAQKKKNKEDETQILQLPKDLPASVAGPTHRLVFRVTPLSAKGLLSAQIRDGLHALLRQSSGETVLKIRAFVAGSGDLRRVRDLVSEVFTDRKQPLPALSLIRAGGLPLEGAQVVLEAISAARKEVDPFGLAWISAQMEQSDNPLDPAAPMANRSLARLDKLISAAGAEPADVLRVTCFLSRLDGADNLRGVIADKYPHAATDIVETQRTPVEAVAACEAVARLHSDPGGALRLLNPEGVAGENGQSQIALVNSADLILTGTQASFGYQEADSKLAFQRLLKELHEAGGSAGDVAFVHYYPLSGRIAQQVRQLRGGFLDSNPPPAGSLAVFEGLPSMDAGFALEAVAVKEVGSR
ncbi:MAG: RidA family protein [Bryobacteraceae bacterium]|jgi:enamine deaminase RidA (YjgF/YER057c/UK114 family)